MKETKGLDTHSFYENAYNSSHIDPHHQFLADPITKLIHKNIFPSSQKFNVLDLGSGNGSMASFIASQGHQVTGIEVSSSGINHAQQNFPECDFIQASIYDLPYAKLQDKFDVVIAVEVIEHLLYPRELLRAAKRCLKPSGQLILTTPYNGYLKNLAIALLNKTDQHHTVLWDGGHVKFFSVKTLTTLLEREGYTEIDFKFAGRLPFLWKSMVCSASVD